MCVLETRSCNYGFRHFYPSGLPRVTCQSHVSRAVSMYPLATSNYVLSNYATWLSNNLNTLHFLRLFKNQIVPTPGTPLRSFIEADYPGYTPQNLAGQVPAPIKEVDGQYVIQFNSQLFGALSGSQTVYGAYISSGDNVKFSQAFASPRIMAPGNNFLIPIIIDVFSLSILGIPS